MKRPLGLASSEGGTHANFGFAVRSVAGGGL